LDTESLRTYNKIEPSSYSTKDRIIQIIGLSALLLWLVVYAVETMNFNQYGENSIIIKALFFLAAFSFTGSISLGAWAYYKIKSAYCNNPSTRVTNAAKLFISGLFVFMLSIPFILFPESDKFFDIYTIALVYTGKRAMERISKNP
jgi:hypothetical protein